MPRASSSTQASGSSRVKQEKVPERSKRRGRVEEEEEQPQGEEEQNDEEEAEEEDHTQANGSPRGAKRARLNDDGDSVPSQQSGSDPSLPKVKTQPRDVDGYIPGSIVRIQLSNFLTYDYVQFRPGPYLNMIIGPNGTGKSSIACAIALGLNFPTIVLGRANDVNGFVKNGTSEGYVEIELKGPKNRPNLVIRRKLFSSSKSSTFTLNGQPASGKEIMKKMAELNVQVGNLCSFLPQDRVTEFAAMSPQELLRETQLAAGDENLTNWHKTLIDTGKELRKTQCTIKEDEDALKQMQERNEGIEQQVRRVEERKKIENTIALLLLLIPCAEYREIRQLYYATKIAKNKMRDKAQRLKDKNAPAHDLLAKYEKECASLESKRESIKKKTQEKFKKFSAKHNANDSLETDGQNIIDSLSNLKRDEEINRKQIDQLRSDIAKLEDELLKPPPIDIPTEAQLKTEMEEIRAEKTGIMTEKEDYQTQIQVVHEKKARYNDMLARAEQEEKSLGDPDAQKLNMILKWDRDTHDAIVWVRNNRDKFKMEVFETPIMRMSVKDMKFVNAVEACFSNTQLKTFVTQCQEDCDVINKHINDGAGLGRKARVTTWFRPYNENLYIPPPMSKDEMRQMKFNGYAIDYVDFPEGMRWFLNNLGLHRTAIALDGSTIDVNQAMQLVARPLHNYGGGASFICGPTMNTVSRSRYGRKALGNMTKDINNARSLIVPPTDFDKVRRIGDQKREAQEGLALCEEQRRPIMDAFAALDKRMRANQDRVEQLQRRREVITKEERRVSMLQTKLTSKKASLKKIKAKPSAENQKVELNKQLRSIIAERVQLARDSTNLVHNIIVDQQECTKQGLNYMQVNAKKKRLQEECQRKDAKFQAALLEYTKLSDKFKATKEKTTEILQKVRDALDNSPEEIQAKYNEQEVARLAYEEALREAKENNQPDPDPGIYDMRSSTELEAELGTLQAQLEMLLNTNPGVIEQYEKRKRDIEQLEKTLEANKKIEEKLTRNIKNARDNWQPALQRLVSSIGAKFSAAFDRIGCAGEIRIKEDDDFEKWAIEILVKFRDSEKLQLLTAHRQSGGERSLTTVLYLLSLTDQARAPFSLVDEINQGMDQRAERMVHNAMVGVTCKADSGQYFLITPKLLPDLEYDEKMKMLVINNGEWLPEEKDIGCMNDMIDLYLHSKRTAASSTSSQ